MSVDTMKSLHEELTDLLMENGCSVTKTGIDALVRFIAMRDQSTTDKIIRDIERTKEQLSRDEYFGTRIEQTNEA